MEASYQQTMVLTAKGLVTNKNAEARMDWHKFDPSWHICVPYKLKAAHSKGWTGL